MQLTEVKLLSHDRELVAARFSPCGRFVFAGSYDGTICRWETTTWQKMQLIGHRGWVQGLVFHPDGRRMFTLDSWGNLIAWPYGDDMPPPLWTVEEGHSKWTRSLAISGDGSLLATCGADRIVRIWSTDDGTLVRELPGWSDDLLCVQWHLKEPALLVGDLKGVVTHVDTRTFATVRQLDAKLLYLRPQLRGTPEINDVGGVRCMSFSADGATLAVSGSEPKTSGFFTGKPTVLLFDWQTGERRQTMQLENADPADGLALDAAFMADGTLMAACSGQPGKGALWLWKPGEKAPAHLDAKLSHSRSVSYHADAKLVALAQVFVKSGNGSGNGRRTSKRGEYIGLLGQVRILQIA